VFALDAPDAGLLAERGRVRGQPVPLTAVIGPEVSASARSAGPFPTFYGIAKFSASRASVSRASLAISS
jgi:hypothetical protein